MCKYFLIILLFIGFVSQGQTPMRMLAKKASATISYQNLVLYSEQLDNAAWAKTNWTITTNQGTDLDGNVTIDLVTNTGSNSGNVSQSLSVVASTNYILSFDAKKGTANSVSYAIYDASNYAYIVTSIEFQNDANSSTVTRISRSFTTPSGCTSISLRIPSAWLTGTVYIGRVQIAEVGKAYITTTNLQVQ